MKGGYWMIRTVKSGNVVEKSQFFCGVRKPRRDRRKGSSTVAKMDQNMTQAVRRLARTINCNFGPSDLLITLTYNDDRLPLCYQDADKCVALFSRRMERSGVKLTGVWITADKDKQGNTERLHHHAIVKGAGIELKKTGEVLTAYVNGKKLEDVWGCGIVHSEHLEAQEDYTPLAAYMVRQAVDVPDAKKWHSSRGLAKPIVEDEVITDQAEELRAPGGADVLEIGHYDAETGSHYIRYIRRTKKAKEGRVDETVKRNFVNRYGLKGYRLPPKTYKRARYLVEDYPRIKAEYDGMLSDTPNHDGQPRENKPGNPTQNIAVRRAELGNDLRAVELALQYIPKEYATQIFKHLTAGTVFAQTAHRNTWQNWTQVYLYMVAILRGY